MESINGFIDIFGEKNHNISEITELNNFVQFANAGLVPKGGFNAPLYAMWELTNACPNECIYCYNGSHCIKEKELTSKQKFEIADQLIDAGIFQICLTGGEPRTCLEHLDLIRYFRTNGVDVGTILSGALLNRADIIKIAKYVSMIQVSLDGSTKEIHDMVRHREGSFEEAIYAIKTFVSLGVDVKVSFAATKYNIDDFENTYKLCESLGVSSLRTQRLAVSGRAKENEADIYATEEQIQKLEKFIASKLKEQHPKMMIEYRNPYEHVEFGIKNGYAIVARITPQGFMSISPYVDAYFGDLRKESFKKIWNRMRMGWHEPKMRKLAESLISRNNGTLYNPLDERVLLGGI